MKVEESGGALLRRIGVGTAAVLALALLLLAIWIPLQRPRWEEFQRRAANHPVLKKYAPPPATELLVAFHRTWGGSRCVDFDAEPTVALLTKIDLSALDRYLAACPDLDHLVADLQRGIDAAGPNGYIEVLHARMGIDRPLPDFLFWRGAAKALLARTLLAARDGDHGEASRLIGMGRQLAAIVARDHSTILSRTIAVVLERYVNELEARLAVGLGSPAGGAKNLPKPGDWSLPQDFFGGQIREFIIDLADRRDFRIAYILAGRFGFDSLHPYAIGAEPLVPESVLGRSRLLRLLRKDIPVISKSIDYLCARECLRLLDQAERAEAELARRPFVYDPISGDGPPELSELLALRRNLALKIYAKFSIIASESRMLVRTAIALARYRDERGVFPETLTALVPGHLPEIPRSPLREEEITYRLGPRSIRLGWEKDEAGLRGSAIYDLELDLSRLKEGRGGAGLLESRGTGKSGQVQSGVRQ